jgi:hypothetical protein
MFINLMIQWSSFRQALLSSGDIHCTRYQKYNIKHPNYVRSKSSTFPKLRQTSYLSIDTYHVSQISLGSAAKWLTEKLVNLVQRGYRTNKEVIRLQAAQKNAAVSAARLATAVAGIVGNCPFESTNMNGISMNDMGKHSSKKMHAAITSAAALVAASCAEAARTAGASREEVSSVISMGLETRAMGDLLTFTTSTAACKNKNRTSSFSPVDV